ncbi:HNH endonuclease [Desulfomicrobium baculatum]|uniref:Restriction endonuclease n=1 Tax=Desulfomicrobium baculatum (strain DSM 4028 / VKM B-1378 / X) TaxID=525897 RepID=C7LPI3_DESBD|nr:HNH endonuclease [Desulfomicrobium baculatum]ACU89026.1 restriction endonuclease [Desulfomicrobium baculatum DSM 4028]
MQMPSFAFPAIRQDTNRATWPTETFGRAPYKPFLLLAVLDLMDAGRITENRIVPDDDLTDAFMLYWNAILPDRLRPSLHLPFFYLRTDGFWTLHPIPGKTLLATEPSSWRNVRERYAFASLNEGFFEHLKNPQKRATARLNLIRRSFAPVLEKLLLDLANTQLSAFDYADILLRETPALYEKAVEKPARDQAFRRVIVKVYDHRCALCGIRIISPDSRTVVDAAHIKDWAVSHDDSPTNGLALCKLCHWTFDSGLVGFDDDFKVIVARSITRDGNLPGHIQQFANRPMIMPERECYYPATDNLAWHRQRYKLG